jgi:hypothetical protein
LLKLRYEYNPDGSLRDTVEEFQFGDEVHDAAQVEDCIKRAQKAILNPGKPRETFME